MRKEPDAGALVGHSFPVIQRNDLVQLRKSGSRIAGRLTHGKNIAVFTDLKHSCVFQKILRRSAAVADE